MSEALVVSPEVLAAYDNLDATLTEDLRATGFNAEAPIPGEEPCLLQGADQMSMSDLKVAYDAYLAFYEYLTTQEIRFSTQLLIQQAKLEFAVASITLQVGKNKSEYPNAEMREAAVKVAPEVVSAGMEVLYLRGMRDALEERRKKLSKTMERLYRELMLRTDRNGPPGMDSFHAQARNFGSQAVTASRFKKVV
jgi:hypothetical protein